jgi:hypothetical protein
VLKSQGFRKKEKASKMRPQPALSFHERILGKYLVRGLLFPVAPQMLFSRRATRFFSFSAGNALAVQLQILNRFSLFFNGRTSPVSHAGSSQLSYHLPVAALSFRERSRVPGEKFHQTVFLAGTRKMRSRQTIHPGGAVLPSMAGLAFERGGEHGFNDKVVRRFRIHNLFGSHENRGRLISRVFSGPHAGRTTHGVSPRGSSDQKHRSLSEEVRTRPVMPSLRLSDATVFPKIRRQYRGTVTEEPRGYFLQGSIRIEREISELKRIVRKTDEEIRRDVSQRISAIAEMNRPVDVGGLSLQVYRNIERMIRSERERRGM